MPNHVINCLSIKGPKRELNKLKKAVTSSEKEGVIFDFDKIIPEPEYEIPESDWYDWRIENWDTKWNSYGNKLITFDGELTFWFKTAWSAPFKVISTLVENYSDLQIEHRYADENYGSNTNCDGEKQAEALWDDYYEAENFEAYKKKAIKKDVEGWLK
jgi:hypothetical protein